MNKKIIKTQEDLDYFFDSWNQKQISVDIETEMIQGKDIWNLSLYGIGISTDKEGFYIACFDYDLDITRFQDILDRAEKIIFHNAKFDITVLEAKGFIFEEKKVQDTLIMCFLLDENRPTKKLKDLAISDLGFESVIHYDDVGYQISHQTSLFEEQEKEERNENMGKYCLDDCLYTFLLYEKYEELLKKQGLWKIYEEIEIPTMFLTKEMQVRGIKLDEEYLEELDEKLEKEIIELQAEIFKLLEVEFINLNSAEQIAEILFRKFNLPGARLSEKTGKFTLPSDLIKELTKKEYKTDKKKQQAIEACKKLLDYREKIKLSTTYTRGLMKKAIDGVIHASFNTTLVKTSRFSSSGPNLQNIPSRGDEYDIRRAFVAREGYSLVNSDYCLAEGTGILTEEGLKFIEDVKIGDKVLQPDNTYQYVERVANSGEKECVVLETEYGNRIVSTPEHRFRVFNSEEGYCWKRLKDLNISDFIAINKEVILPKKKILLSLPKEGHYLEHKKVVSKLLTKDFSIFLGYLTGDGYISKKTGTIKLVINQKDADIIEDLKDKMKRHLGCKIKGEVRYRGVVEFGVHSKYVKRWLKEVIGISKESIPLSLLMNNEEVLCGFLQGYFEADGSCSERVSISSSRRQIIQEVQIALGVLGIDSNIRIQYSKIKGKSFLGYQLTIPYIYNSIFQEKIGFLSKRKKQKLETLCKKKEKSTTDKGIPFYKKAGLSENSKVNALLANARNLGRVITKYIAKKVKELDFSYYKKLNLDLILENNLSFQKISSISSSFKVNTYDLQVSDTNQFIANNFVVHNSQVELRLIAHCSQDPQMREVYLNDGDIHQRTADLCHCSRKEAKILNFGILYGMSPISLSGILEVSEKQAKEFMEKYFFSFQGVTSYIENTKKELRRKGFVRTITGRIRRLPEVFSTNYGEVSHAERQGVNFTIQGLAADLMKIAMRNIRRVLKQTNTDAHILIQIHDEIVVECPDKNVERVKEIIKTEMEAVGKNLSIPLKTEPSVSKVWVK